MDIRELTLLCRTTANQRSFYEDVLGFRVVDDSPDAFTVHAGRTRLTFLQAGPGTEPRYHFALNIAENKLAEARDWLDSRARLFTVNDDPVVHFRSWDAHSVYFRDPAGNIVEFIARHGQRTATTRRFDATCVLGVSEVGMPVGRVDEVARRLDEAIGVAVWDRTGDRFAAIGDEDGLLILVPMSHNWYPTDESVAAHPIRMTIAGRVDAAFEVPGRPYRIFVRRS